MSPTHAISPNHAVSPIRAGPNGPDLSKPGTESMPFSSAPSRAPDLHAVVATRGPGSPQELLGVRFEAAMLQPMLSAMLPDRSDGFWGGHAGASWRGLFAEALSDALAQAGGIGLAEMVERNLRARQTPGTAQALGVRADASPTVDHVEFHPGHAR